MSDFDEQFERSMDGVHASVESLADGTYAPEDVDTSNEGFRPAEHWIDNNVLDFDFTVGRDLSYKSTSLCVAFGGPNIFVNLEEAKIDGYWGSTHLTRQISYAARDKLDEEMDYIYDVLKGNL
jgi:hypothetical protein